MNRIYLLIKVVLALLFLYLINTSQLDSLMWMENGRVFLEALKTGEVAKTYIGPDLYHPGLTILWISAAIQLFFGWASPDYLIVIYRAIFLGVFSGLFYLGFKLWIRQFKATLFFLSLTYLLLNPYSLLWGTLTWLDTLLLALTLPVLLVWYEFLKTNRPIYLIGTGLLIGLSVLTKYLGTDRYLMIIIITGLFASQQKSSFSRYFASLFKVGLIAFLTFVILFPAFWVNPGLVLFGRFDTSQSFQTLSYTHITPAFNTYLKYLWRVDLLIWLGIAVLLIRIRKQYPLILLGFSGLINFGILMLALFFLMDQRRGVEAFLSSIGRYQIGAVFLLSPLYFDFVLNLKVDRLIKWWLIIVPFIIELYFVYRMTFYPWIT